MKESKYSLAKVKHAALSIYESQKGIAKEIGKRQAEISLAFSGERKNILRLIINLLVEQNGYEVKDFLKDPITDLRAEMEELKIDHQEIKENIEKLKDESEDLKMEIKIIKKAIID